MGSSSQQGLCNAFLLLKGQVLSFVRKGSQYRLLGTGNHVLTNLFIGSLCFQKNTHHPIRQSLNFGQHVSDKAMTLLVRFIMHARHAFNESFHSVIGNYTNQGTSPTNVSRRSITDCLGAGQLSHLGSCCLAPISGLAFNFSNPTILSGNQGQTILGLDINQTIYQGFQLFIGWLSCVGVHHLGTKEIQYLHDDALQSLHKGDTRFCCRRNGVGIELQQLTEVLMAQTKSSKP